MKRLISVLLGRGDANIWTQGGWIDIIKANACMWQDDGVTGLDNLNID
jgi:hypothetical protein